MEALQDLNQLLAEADAINSNFEAIAKASRELAKELEELTLGDLFKQADEIMSKSIYFDPLTGHESTKSDRVLV